MSINPAREAKRLADTITKISEVEKALATAKAKLSFPNLDKLLEGLKALTNKRDAMEHARELAVAHIAHWNGKEAEADYPAEEIKLDQEQIEAADASLLSYTNDLVVLNGEIASEVERTQEAREKAEAEVTKADFQLSALLVRKSLQEEALKKQEASYPQALARHLRKCRKYGWSDQRLTGGGKK